MLFAFTSRGFYIIDCQDSPNIIFDFAHHRFLHETGLERHFSTASQFSYDNACVCSNNKPLDWFSSLFFVCAFFHFVTNHSNNEIGILFALGNNIIFCSIYRVPFQNLYFIRYQCNNVFDRHTHIITFLGTMIFQNCSGGILHGWETGSG